MIFESAVQVVGELPSFPQSVIRLEASQGRVSIAEALQGGPAHRAFIEGLPAAWRADLAVEIFSRVLWLKEGWYPLTPHYHFDWGQGLDGPRVETLMCLFGEVSLTEFILGPLRHPAAREDEPGHRRSRWDAVVEAGLREGSLRTWRLEPGKLVLFDDRSLHRARPATKSGWRVLVRAIRGLPRGDDLAYGNPGRFTTCRNGFIPETNEEQARHEPYRDEPGSSVERR